MMMNLGTAAEIHVYTNNTIQNAVNNATPGDTIIIHNGTYIENVNVNKTLTIMSYSENPLDTIVQADDKNKYIFNISADSVTINGLYIRNASGLNIHGIYMVSSNNCTIKNNKVSYVEHGDGIHLAYSSNNTLTNNTVNSNGLDGIRIFNSKNNVLNNNVALYNDWNGYFSEISVNNTLDNNIASGNYLAGIHSYESEKDTLINNNLSKNEIGIYIYKSQDMYLDNNTISSNQQGIYMHACSKINTVQSNKMLTNINGVSLVETSDCKIINNNVSKNSYGIFLSETSNNILYDNYFNNTLNVLIDGDNNANIWNTTRIQGTSIIFSPYLGGNYWAQPDGRGFSQSHKDSDLDGIANSFYVIDDNNIDYLPLTMNYKEVDSLIPVLITSIILIFTLLIFRKFM